MKKINIISGIQPTGRLHIGNYLGAIKNFLKLQENSKYNCFFFITDLHSLTEIFNPKEINQNIKNLILDFFALGLTPKKSNIFLQSKINAHSELFCLLTNITPFGELKRMTQFKEKSQKQENNINAGLFNYPILMTADILLYDAKYVPVGEDQLQHLELARTLARKFNHLYGKTFVEPKPILTPAPKIKNLLNPLKKMSKSEPKGCLFLDDEPEIIKEKILKALTDSGKEIKFDLENKPGISNLILIYQNISNLNINQIEKKYQNKDYITFKKDLINLIIDYFKNYRRQKKFFKQKEDKIITLIDKNSKKVNALAQNKIKVIKQKMGLLI